MGVNRIGKEGRYKTRLTSSRRFPLTLPKIPVREVR